MPTIGQKLEETRVGRGLSIEDVAHETRIHPNMILDIEEDDFSRFPSVAYAKSFVRKYGDHLGLDLGEAMDALNSGVTRLGDNALMGEMKRTIKKDRRFRLERFGRGRPRPGKAKGAPLFLNLILGVLMGAIGIFYFLGYNAPNAQQAKADIARGLGLPLPPAPPVEEAVVLEPNPLKPATPPAVVAEPAPEQPAVVSDDGKGAPSAPSPKPGTPPVYPVLKPAVELRLDDTLAETPAAPPSPPSGTAEAAKALRPRETRLDLANDTLAPPPLGSLPSGPGADAEPQAVLRPEGTDPAATTQRKPEPGRGQPPTPGKPAEEPKPDQSAPTAQPVRAVPVAASE